VKIVQMKKDITYREEQPSQLDGVAGTGPVKTPAQLYLGWAVQPPDLP
jgi:hypothetical protein